jgi:hypothetical protein
VVIRCPYRLDDGRRSFIALHGYTVNTHLGQRPAPAQNVHDVPDRGPRRRGDHGDAAWECRQSLLVTLVKQSFGCQHFLQFLESGLQGAFASLLQHVGDQLVVAAGFVQADAAVGAHLHTVFRHENQAARVGAKQCAADLGPVVLQGEVNVA